MKPIYGQGNIEYWSGKVREKSGNFKLKILWEPCIKKGRAKNISKQIANEHLSNVLESQDQTTIQSVHSKPISDFESGEKTKKALAKQKAIEIYKKSQSHKSKERKTVAAKHNSKSSKSTIKSDTRKVLSQHNLSESDDD